MLQETDPGKFTVAFSDWRDALVWAVHLRQRLAMQEFPSDLRNIPELTAPAAAAVAGAGTTGATVNVGNGTQSPGNSNNSNVHKRDDDNGSNKSGMIEAVKAAPAQQQSQPTMIGDAVVFGVGGHALMPKVRSMPCEQCAFAQQLMQFNTCKVVWCPHHEQRM